MLVKNGGLKQEAFTQKKKGSQPLFKELSHSGWLALLHPAPNLSRLTGGCFKLLSQWLTGTTYLGVGSSHGRLTKSKEQVQHMDLGTIGGLKALAWCRWTVGAWQLLEDLG